MTFATLSINSLILLTDTADTSSPACWPMPNRALSPPTVNGADPPSSSTPSGSMRWPANCNEMSSTSKSRPRSSHECIPASGARYAVACGGHGLTPREYRVSIRLRQHRRGSARRPRRGSDLRGALAIRAHLQGAQSHYRLDELPTRNAHIVEALLIGAVITLLVSRRPLQAVRERLRRTPYTLTEQRSAAILAAPTPAILDNVFPPPQMSKVFARRLESMVLYQAPDQNPSRRFLIERVKSGASWA